MIRVPCLLFGALLLVSCQHGVSSDSSPDDRRAAAATVATTPPVAPSAYAAVPPPSSPESTYVFGWGQLPSAIGRPRGGTTQGTSVALAPVRPVPLPAIASASNAFERDRAAILSLAGDYRVGFHFMESLGLTEGYQPVRPYHSWATEHVRVLQDTGRFISLQHTLVMFFPNPDGTPSAPLLTKHWRQDWTYEDTDLHTYRGAATWARRRPAPHESAGAWSQAVFQVDDSPRYESLGRWEHRGNLVAWTSEREWRPLPRREHSVRKDYDVMEGVHRIVLTPTGWIHEQNNLKRVAGEVGGTRSPPRYLASEIGLDRYERITGPSLDAADDYWRKTGGYWAIVRRVWEEIFSRHERFTLRASVDDRALFEHHFAYAEKLEVGRPFDPADAERHVRSTLQRFVEHAP
jgi:hypothetical protein